MRTSIGATDADELRRLYRALPPLVWNATNAIKTSAPDQSMRGAEFLRFREQHTWTRRYSPDPDSPVVGVTWYDAAAYCNWLSERAGISEAQWCYDPNADGEYAEGMRISQDGRHFDTLPLTGSRGAMGALAKCLAGKWHSTAAAQPDDSSDDDAKPATAAPTV